MTPNERTRETGSRSVPAYDCFWASYWARHHWSYPGVLYIPNTPWTAWERRYERCHFQDLKRHDFGSKCFWFWWNIEEWCSLFLNGPEGSLDYSFHVAWLLKLKMKCIVLSLSVMLLFPLLLVFPFFFCFFYEGIHQQRGSRRLFMTPPWWPSPTTKPPAPSRPFTSPTTAS